MKMGQRRRESTGRHTIRVRHRRWVDCFPAVDLLHSRSSCASKPHVLALLPETAELVEHFRRTDPRYDRRVDVEIKAGTRLINARSKNLSLGGMFVESAELL